MRYWQLIEDYNPIDDLRSSIVDYIVSLKSQKIDSISLNQLIQNLSTDSRLNNMDIDQKSIETAISGIKDVSLSTNANGVMTMNISDKEQDETTSDSQDKVNDLAMAASLDSIKG